MRLRNPMNTMNQPARPRLLIISQVYVPDTAAVGQYMADVATEMAARGWDVVVYTSARGYDDPSVRFPARETVGGVQIRRLPLSSFGKRSIAVRLVAQTLFMVQAVVRSLFAGRFTMLLVTTSPPFAGFFGAVLSVVKRVPFVWWLMDLNPDQMVATGKLSETAVLARVFDWMNRLTIRRARAVVVLDRFMRDRVVAKCRGESLVADKVHVLPPWSLDTHLVPRAGAAAAFRARHGLGDAFVVMYAGNHSEQHPLDTLLMAAERLTDVPRMRFVFVGGGTGKREIDRRIAEGGSNLVSLPYQPIADLAATLAAADLHVVSVGPSSVGIVHPCKIYGAMAVGRPILLLGPDLCHATDIMQHDRIGWHVRHGDVSGAESALREAVAMNAEELQGMGRQAAGRAASNFSRKLLIDRFCHHLTPDHLTTPGRHRPDGPDNVASESET